MGTISEIFISNVYLRQEKAGYIGSLLGYVQLKKERIVLVQMLGKISHTLHLSSCSIWGEKKQSWTGLKKSILLFGSYIGKNLFFKHLMLLTCYLMAWEKIDVSFMFIHKQCGYQNSGNADFKPNKEKSATTNYYT